MKKVFILFVSLLVLFVSCDPEQIATPLDDSRFNGNYHHYEHWEDEHGIEESTRSIFWHFDGTNKARYYTKYWYWSDYSGWVHSGNYKGDPYMWDYEIEVNADHTAFRQRLWNNKYSEWSEWMPYEFSVDGSVLRICRFPSVSPDQYKEYSRY